MFQGPPGLSFGPNLPSPKFKEVKAKRRKVKSRAVAEKERKNKRPERQKEREEWLQRRAKRREEEKLKRGEPEVTKAKRCTRKSNHGTEKVDSIILKFLGKSQKSRKVVSKTKAKMVQSSVVPGPTWRHGMREERHEGRTVKGHPEMKRSRKLRKSQVSPKADKPPKVDIHQAVPIVDVGPDYGADGVHPSGPHEAEDILSLAAPPVLDSWLSHTLD